MEEDQFLDEKTISILAYIKENPGATENKVATYMADKRICSRLTSLNKIENLISSGKVLDLKQNNSFHRLFINDDNEFNRIDKMLSQIQRVIDAMDKPLGKINQELVSKNRNKQWPPELVELRDHLRVPYTQAVNIMLQALLVQIMNILTLENDRQILYSRITKLMQKLTQQYLVLHEPIRILDNLSESIKELDRLPHIRDYSNNLGLDIIDLPYLIITIIQNFKKQFPNIQ